MVKINTYLHTVEYSHSTLGSWNYLSSKNDVLSKGIGCTDYLLDVLCNGKCAVWGGSNKIPKNQTRFLYQPRNKKMLKEQLRFLHSIEKANRYKLTEVLDVQGYPKHVVIVGSPSWSRDTYSLSLYTKIIRNLGKTKVKEGIPANFENFSTEWLRFLRWIAYTGNLRKVNKNCTTVCGWGNKKYHYHGSDGIFQSIRNVFSDYHVVSTRATNLRGLYKEMISEG